MPNPNYADARWKQSAQIASDPSTMATPSKQGKEKLEGPAYRESDYADKDAPMRYGTAPWKNMEPGGGIRQQPRDRTWGMRQADGVCYDIGLARPDDDSGEQEETVIRGSVDKSKTPGRY